MTERPWICRTCFVILLAAAILALPGYYMLLNWFGPSTLYLEPTLPTAVPTGEPPHMKPTVYIGDDFYIAHMTVRFERNGNCLLKIHRYAEHVGGPTPGKKYLIDYAELQFVGANDIMRPRWPPYDHPYVLGFARDEQGNYLLDKPLLPEGVDELEMDFFVTPRNFCNMMDYIIPRYTTVPRVRALVKRHKP